MLVMDVRGLGGADKAYARFWNHLHSIESALSGVKLGLWMTTRPVLPPSTPAGEIVEFGWPGGGDLFEAEQRRLGPEALTGFDWTSVGAVALARFELAPGMRNLLAERFDYSATLPRQVNGWWTDDVQAPGSRPGGALLPEHGDIADGVECLVLVDVDDWWGILSTRALGTYVFGTRLEAGEPVRFLDESGRRWAVERLADLNRTEVRARYGEGVAKRARADAPAVHVRVAAVN